MVSSVVERTVVFLHLLAIVAWPGYFSCLHVALGTKESWNCVCVCVYKYISMCVTVSSVSMTDEPVAFPFNLSKCFTSSKAMFS